MIQKIKLFKERSNRVTGSIGSGSPPTIKYKDIVHDSERSLSIGGPDGTKDYIVGASNQMREIYKKIINIIKNSPIRDCILIRGDTGTGKDLVARAIHYNNSESNGKPYVKVDMASLAGGALAQTELFGHERGAFTDARDKVLGRLSTAKDGTLVLDEISTLPHDAQSYLLRVVDERRVSSIGSGGAEYKIDARMIICTNGKLEEMIRNNEFREDLFHRLNQISIYIPPLRERKEDIPLIAIYFLEMYNHMYNKKFSIDSGAMNELTNYDWPGNVRHLNNTIKKLVFDKEANSDRAAIINREDVIKYLKSEKELSIKTADDDLFQQFKNKELTFWEYSSKSTEDAEKEAIKYVILQKKGNLWNVALELGINYKTLYNKMKGYKILTQDVLRDAMKT